MIATRIYSTSNSDFNKLAFGETKADINRETGEKSGETMEGGEKSSRGEGGGYKGEKGSGRVQSQMANYSRQ